MGCASRSQQDDSTIIPVPTHTLSLSLYTNCKPSLVLFTLEAHVNDGWWAHRSHNAPDRNREESDWTSPWFVYTEPSDKLFHESYFIQNGKKYFLKPRLPSYGEGTSLWIRRLPIQQLLGTMDLNKGYPSVHTE